MPAKLHPSICRFCHANCGILVEVEDGRPTRVTGDKENPAYHGYTCAKGRQLPLQHAHPERLLHSQQRKPDGSFEAISSELAMDEIGERVRALVEKYGPRSIALYVGTHAGPHPASIPFSVAWLLALGSRMVFTAATIDQPGKSVANALHGRWLAGANVFDESDVWMLVGNNPLITMSGGIPPANPGKRLRDAKARGMKLIVIDPRKTEVARFADIFLQPKPGEDPSLLAALLHVILREDLYDRDFVAEHCEGVEALKAVVAPMSPEAVAERTGVSAQQIAHAARTFAEGRRGCGVAGTGPNMAPHGNLTEYLLLCLNSICGRWRREGECVPNPGVFLPPTIARAQAQAPRRASGFGERLRVRGLSNSAAGLPTAALADEILLQGEGKVRALICVGSNPMAAWPDQLKTERAMCELDLLVCLDMKMAATSRLADFVIAPKLSLEVPGLSVSMEILEQTYVAMGYSEAYGQYSPAIVDPPAGSDVIEEWEFFYGLAKRMGLPLTLYPARPEAGALRPRREPIAVAMDSKPTTDEVFERMFPDARVPLSEVREHPHGAVFPSPAQVVAAADPERRARLELGDPDMLAELAELESAGPDPEDPAFPLRLVSRRLPNAYNSSGRDIDALTRGRHYNPAFLHPADAKALGLRAGDAVRIRSRHASIRGVLAFAPELRRGVVSMAHCFGDGPQRDEGFREIGSNTGRLVDAESEFDRFTGIPRMSAIPVAIEAL